MTGKEREYKRILVVEVNWVGDILFSTPFLKALRKKFKDAYIACMTPPAVSEILKNNPAVDRLIVYDEKGSEKRPLGKIRFISRLRKEHFDLAVLLHRSFTRTLVTALAGIKERAGYITAKRKFLLTIPIEIPSEDLHKVEYFLNIGSALGCDTSDKNYEFYVGNKAKNWIDKELKREGVGENDTIVVLNPGANWAPKRWPERKFAELADKISEKYAYPVIISGAKKDIPLAEKIRSLMKREPIVFCGKMTFEGLGALLARANFVISGDSGPMHMAVALKSNVIALFGPTSPFLTGPYGDGSYRVIQKTTGCEIPCYEVDCGQNACMDAIETDDVLRVFDRMQGSYA